MTYSKNEIHCPKCNHFIGYSEDYMYVVLYNDVTCEKCGAVVIPSNQITC